MTTSERPTEDVLRDLEHGDKRTCPFPNIDIDEHTPCPVCGDLGTFDTANLARPIMCVDRSVRLLNAEAAATIRRLEAEKARMQREHVNETERTRVFFQNQIDTEKARAEAAEAERDKAECREWTRIAEAEGLTCKLEQSAAEAEALQAENFALSANQCEGGYGDEYGNHRCTVVDVANAQVAALMAERDQLEARVTELEGALRAVRPVLDGVVALDDEDADESGNSETCAAAIREIDRTLRGAK